MKKLTTETNVAAPSESSPFNSVFVLLKLLVLLADFTNNWFVNFVGVDVASSSARAIEKKNEKNLVTKLTHVHLNTMLMYANNSSIKMGNGMLLIALLDNKYLTYR